MNKKRILLTIAGIVVALLVALLIANLILSRQDARKLKERDEQIEEWQRLEEDFDRLESRPEELRTERTYYENGKVRTEEIYYESGAIRQEVWYSMHGQIHREDDLPAVIWYSKFGQVEREAWYLDGELIKAEPPFN